MSAWDQEIFTLPVNQDFLDELATLDDEDILEAVEDLCTLVVRQDNSTEEEQQNALCAATIAAIWAGAPFSAGDVVEEYPFIRSLSGKGSEALEEAALEVLESVEDQDLVEEFIESLS